MPLRLTPFEFDRLQRRRQKRATPAVSPRPVASRVGRTQWEQDFAAQLDESGYAGRYETGYQFLQGRKFAFDFAFPPEKIAVEVDGGVHRTSKRFDSDREKLNLAVLDGWRVLRVSNQQVRTGDALYLVKSLLWGLSPQL